MRDRVCIIAEAGVNHNGRLDLALKLCNAAKDIGVDIIKFQTFQTIDNVIKDCQMPEYQKINSRNSKSHWDLVKGLELNYEKFRKIKKYCDKIGIEFLSTPSEVKSLEFLASLGLKKIKVSSGEITNVPLLRKIGGLKKQVIVSTGMSYMKEITDAISILVNAGTRKEDITVLHCNTEYPTPIEDVNLLAMLTIKNKLKVKIGYSDHTLGIEVPIAAVALGATIIEKHLTLSRKLKGPDHAASLEPEEMKVMVRCIRNIEKALGDGVKKPTVSELKNKVIARKCIVAAKNIKKGQFFTEDNLTVKRPERGVSALFWDKIIRRKAKKDFKENEVIAI